MEAQTQKKGGTQRVGGAKVGGPTFRVFFYPSPAPILALLWGSSRVFFFSLSGVFSCLFFSLWGSSRGIVVVFWIPAPSNVHVWESPQTRR